MARLADAQWAACQPGTGHREMQIRACRDSAASSLTSASRPTTS
jgi:hypothetical protein